MSANRSSIDIRPVTEKILLKLSSSLRLEEVLSVVTDCLVAQFNATFAGIWLAKPGDICKECPSAPSCPDRSHCLHLAAFSGTIPSLREVARIPLDPIGGESLSELRRPIVIGEISGNGACTAFPWARNGAARSFVGFPLRFGPELLGFLGFFSELKTDDYLLDYLSTISKHASIAIQNARLFENVQDLNRKLGEKVQEMEGANERLRKANEELKEFDELKDNFQANVSHELKTPLVSGMGYIELILKNGLGPVNDAQRKGLEVSYRNLIRLSSLIDDLLTFSGLYFREEEMLHSHFPLAELVEECVEDLKIRVAHSGKDASIQAPLGDLPAIFADRQKIYTVFTNLLSNAEKFSPGGIRVKITAERVSPERVRVRVADEGIGIPQEKQQIIFDRFRQVDGSSTRRYAGMGIGLSLVKEILAQHSCGIWVNSSAGKGATFEFDLPIGNGTSVPEEHPEVAGIPARPAPADGKRPRILVVDDEYSVVEFVKVLLAKAEFDVLTASSGEECLAILDRNPVDLVLLDLSLDGMDGTEVLRRIRGDGRVSKLPVYMLSARVEDRAKRASFEAGCDGYIVKPFKVDEFLHTVRSVVVASRG